MPRCAAPARTPAAAVRAGGATVTEVSGAGPVIAGTIIGDVAGVSRFPGRARFAAYNGTAPAGVSPGNRKIRRLSLRGSRRISHAIPMAAITRAALSVLRFRQGRWREIVVDIERRASAA